MRNFKRIISLIISGAMLTASLAGCDVGESSKKEEESVSSRISETEENEGYAYDLSKISIDYLSKLDKTIEFYFLMEMAELRSENVVEDFVNLLDTYAEFECIDFKAIDPDKNPDIMAELSLNGFSEFSKGDIILKCGDNLHRIQASSIYTYEFDENGTVTNELFNGENLITSAIKAVAEESASTVYFLTNHDEKTIETDYNVFAKNLISVNYTPAQLNLESSESVPDDAAMVIIAAPKSDISDKEKAKLEEYMDRGGNLSLLMSPNESDCNYENLTEIMMQYGLAIDFNTVYETNSANHILGDNSTILVKLTDPTEYSDEADDITQGLRSSDELPSYMTASRSVYRITPENASDLIVCPLIETYETAVGKPFGGTDNDRDKNSGELCLAAYPLCLAACSQDKSRNNSKLVVIGNAEFIDDTHVSENYTAIPVMLYLSTISWMYDSNADMGIEPKTVN